MLGLILQMSGKDKTGYLSAVIDQSSVCRPLEKKPQESFVVGLHNPALQARTQLTTHAQSALQKPCSDLVLKSNTGASEMTQW